MDLALGALGSLLPKLTELLKDEYAKQKGLKPAIESLCNELLMMEAALADVSRTPSDQLNEVDKCWARQVRELWYDMEDAVDAFMVRVAGRKPNAAATDANIFNTIAGKAASVMSKFKDRHQIAERIENIKNLSMELSKLHAKYNKISGTTPNVSTSVDPRLLSLYKDETELVGIDKARDDLIRKLTVEGGDESSDLSLKIVSIVGLGGLGKTALARAVHDRLKEKYFDCWAFISVGWNPNIEMIFGKILRQLDKNYKSYADMTKWDAELYIEEIRKFLEEKRYLIVIDDIWDKKSWESISYALLDNKRGSRIIITSRNYGIVSKVSNVYKLQPLSSGNSKELFYKRVFSGEQECLDNKPAEVLEKIMDKCGGVPLAIIAIASLLAGKPWEDWSKVYDSIVFGHEDNTMTILAYSYHDLPSYLKPCLLTLCIFPEDYIIAKSCIICLWIAEGFVKEKDGESPFETGERYFNELLNRCMIQPLQSSADPYISEFGVHDIVLDLIRDLSTQENFVTVLRNKRQHSASDSARTKRDVTSPGYDRKVRRLAIQNFNAAITKDNVVIADGVRSLVITDNEAEMMPPICNFQACRVLDIWNCKYPDLKHLGKLRQLRFLAICNTPVNELPKTIRELKFLQTLALWDIGLEELPAEVCDLTQLMLMVAVGFTRVPADRMGNLVSLEELWLDPLIGRSETEDFVVQLGKLTRLRVLKVRFWEELNESSQEALVKSLCSLLEIKDLELKGRGKKSTTVTAWESWKPPRQLWRLHIKFIRFSRMPVWINPSCLGRLCYLSLSVDAVEPKDIDNLGKLQELLYLKLRGRRIHQGCTIAAQAFKNLRVCKVDSDFKFMKGAMPKLESLSLKMNIVKHAQDEDFGTSDAIPDLGFGLGNLLTLEEIIVSVDYINALPRDVWEAVSLLSRAAKHHPNRPTITIQRWKENPIATKVLDLICVVREEQDDNYHFEDFILFYFGVREVNVDIDCEGARLCRVEGVEAAWRKAVQDCWSQPTLKLKRINADKIVCSSDHSDPEGDQDDSVDANIMP